MNDSDALLDRIKTKRREVLIILKRMNRVTPATLRFQLLPVRWQRL